MLPCLVHVDEHARANHLHHEPLLGTGQSLRRLVSKAVIRAVVSMSRSLGISITAEGVETAEQRDVLRRLGCSDAQGYLFSRPVPASEVVALVGRLDQNGLVT
ncbi:EAL domain-containing protein [Roseomonas chloroacetimidivorans]|uniref:EAL domain-containing protein n=1 Tax=Roseomonas chloroacetimidivorans TaxID=1766656 RepID=UPI003C76F793